MLLLVLANLFTVANAVQVFGDPHLQTFDGSLYSYSGLGEFVLIRADSGASTELDVQVRMTQNVDVSGQPVNASVITAIVIVNRAITPVTTYQFQVNETTGGDIANVTIFINGSRVDATQLAAIQSSSGLISGTSRLTVTGNKVELFYQNVANRDTATFTVSASLGTLLLSSNLNSNYNGRVVGLNGYMDGNKSNDFRYRNGSVAPIDSLVYRPIASPSNLAEYRWNVYISNGTFLGPLTQPFAESWRVGASESLFTYASGESWTTYNILDFQPAYLQELLGAASNASLEAAATACTTNGVVAPQCLQDVLVSNDTGRGQVVIDAIQPPPVVNQLPVFNESAVQIRPNINQLFTRRFFAYDPEGGSVTFSLAGGIANDANASITSDGVFTWKPSSVTPLNIQIMANDSQGAVAVLNVAVFLCACLNNGTCNTALQTEDNTNQFYVPTCTCTAAWDGAFCNQDRNECLNAGCVVNCTDAKAPATGFTCAPCPELGNPAAFCYSDSCKTSLNTCEQNCTSGVNSVICACRNGYDVDPSNSAKCIDKNECNSLPCSNGMICNNTLGSYSCDCPSGLTKYNETSCQDVNECNTNPCNATTQVCLNSPGSYSCDCKTGFTNSSGSGCLDVNECTASTSPCTGNTVCVNEYGSYSCPCASGYALQSGGVCADVDECSTNRTLCPSAPIGICNNFDGSYSCACQSGYALNTSANSCDDINECAANGGKGDCQETCQNIAGSYVCTCPTGYQLDSNNRNCSDINECNGASGCPQNCSNTMGSFTCTCFDGFDLKDGNCVANQTCTSGLVCTNSMCTRNSTGADVCVCNRGYEVFNSSACSDINECSMDTHGCDANAQCTNYPGSFNCTCKSHYIDTSGAGNPSGRNCSMLVAPIVDTILETDKGLDSIVIRWGRVMTGSQVVVFLTEEGSSARLFETTIGINFTQTTFGSLSPNTTYTFHIYTQEGAVVSVANNKTFTTLSALEPPTLQSISSTDVTTTTIQITWTRPPASVPVSGYRVTVQPLNTTNDLPATSLSRSITGLTPGTPYNISVFTLFGVNFSSPATVQQYTVPNPPESIGTAQGATYGDVTVTWSIPSVGGADAYDFRFIPTGPTFKKETATSGTATGLSPGVSYSMFVSSRIGSLVSTEANTSVLVPTTTVAPETTTPVATTPPPDTTLETSAETTVTTPSIVTTAATLVCPAFTANVGGVCMAYQVTSVQLVINEVFNSDLNNRSSAIYIAMSNRLQILMVELFNQAQATFVQIITITFRSGSIVAETNVQLANVTNITETAQNVQQIVENGSLPILTTNNVTSVVVTNFDECSNATTNYCSQYANCTDTGSDAGFTCACFPNYRDKNSSYPGRNCEDQCTLDGSPYCMNNGACTPNANKVDPQCVCAAGFEGTRCEIVSTTTTVTEGSTSTAAATATETSTAAAAATETSTAAATATETSTAASTATETSTAASTATETSTAASTATETSTAASTATETSTAAVTATETSTAAATTATTQATTRPSIQGTLAVTTVVTFTGEFTSALTNPSSSEFIFWSNKNANFLREMFTDVSITFSLVVEVSFTSGSIVATSVVRVASPSISTVNQALDNVSPTILIHYGVEKINVTDYDDCLLKPADCHANSTCVNTAVLPGYTCQCNSGFREKNQTYPGRNCEPQCKLDGADYCLNGAVCNPTVSEPVCTCTQWYEGSRCESTNRAVVAAIVLGVVAGVLLLVTIAVAVVHYKRTRRAHVNLQYSEHTRITREGSDKYRLSEDGSSFGDFHGGV